MKRTGGIALKGHGKKPPKNDNVYFVENIAYELKKAGYYNYAIMTNENASVSGMEIDDSFYYNVPWAELYEPTNVSESITWTFDP